jgi:hypothetical protein
MNCARKTGKAGNSLAGMTLRERPNIRGSATGGNGHRNPWNE